MIKYIIILYSPWNKCVPGRRTAIRFLTRQLDLIGLQFLLLIRLWWEISQPAAVYAMSARGMYYALIRRRVPIKVLQVFAKMINYIQWHSAVLLKTEIMPQKPKNYHIMMNLGHQRYLKYSQNAKWSIKKLPTYWYFNLILIVF